MRRDTWLAGLVGVIVGSWLTLIAVQLEEHGFGAVMYGSGAVADGIPLQGAPKEKAAPPKTEPDKASEADQTTKAAANVEPSPQQTSSDAKQAEQTSVKPAGAKPATSDSSGIDATTAAADTRPSQPADTPSVKAEDSAKTPGTTPTSESDAAAKAAIASAKDKDDASTKPIAGAPEAKAPQATAADKAVQPSSAEMPKAPVTGVAQAEATSKPVPGEAPAKQASAEKTAADQAPADHANARTAPSPDMPADDIDREIAGPTHAPTPQAKPAETALSEITRPDIDPAAKSVELVRPLADNAGVLSLAGKSVQLSGVIPTDVDRTCTGPNGKSWPCGTVARTAFRMYLRGRTIDCDLPSPSWQGTVTGACRYVRIDLSEWLVRFGWAEPEAGSSFASLAEEARQQKRGIYGDDPRQVGRSTLAPAPVKEDPLNPI